MITGIHHISAFVKSAQETDRFYTDLLGLRLVKNTVNQQDTNIRHLFYGDYQGNPGTLLTFFELKKAGHAYLEANFFSTVTLKIPKGSLTFWKERLTAFGLQVEHDEGRLCFYDPDGLSLAFIEMDEILPVAAVVQQTDIPAAHQITGLFEASLKVEYPEKTQAFLTEFLGFKQLNDQQFIDQNQGFITTVLPSDSKKKTRFGRGAIDHIAYGVETEADLEELYQKAQQMSVPIELYVDRDYFKCLYVTDPNGLRIEIATNGPGFAIDESLDSLGDSLALPSFLEDKRTAITQQLEEF